MSLAFAATDTSLLEKLNSGSWKKSFTPEADIDWSWSTTPEEFRALYDSWSLLLGSKHHDTSTDAQRTSFARYQQMNLMLFTLIFERKGLVYLESLFDDDDDARYQEYVTHFVKEETYHTLMFLRAIARIKESDPALKPLPHKHIELWLSFVMWGLRLLPWRRLRHSMFFFLFRFVEEITLQANTIAARAVPRPESLVTRIWELHALDEARHVAFDDLMMRRSALPRPVQALATVMTRVIGALSSMMLNLNEVWAARSLGIRVGYYELPRLMKKTTAPFKRKAFSLLFRGHAMNMTPVVAAPMMTGPFRSESMTSIETYMFGLKERAHTFHNLVYGTFPVELQKLSAMRKQYCKKVRPVTLMPFFIKAVALSVRKTPAVNRILFRKFPWGRRIVRFNVVDVNCPITREVDGEMVTFIGTIRGADKLTVGEIQDQLEKLQRGDPADSPSIEKYRKLKRSPPFVAKIFHWLMTRSAGFYLKNAGTCSLSVLDGMRGDHFFSSGPTTSLFCIGGIGDEVVARDGKPVVRRMLKTALALDNYVVPGLDGVILARTFQELLESCSFVEAELANAPAAKPAPPASQAPAEPAKPAKQAGAA